ncbi:MAG TPA: nitrate reductase subunit alpha [Thermoanaerobaculia bacterium]|nr:nitrate reductase subunit alpha [Thermoanaerobaculia bacterium]
MSWIQDLFSPQSRSWEDFYRNRWAHDRVVRSTHGVNCTGGCSWNIHIKQGLVAWEYQALDYPRFDPEIPSYEPRGCQRGMAQSWYVYSALRVKYPYVRGALLDLWQAAVAKHKNPIAAWESLVTNAEARTSWQKARGKGGFRRASWNEVLPMLAAANLYTARAHGPDRVIGFSPIPAMSMVSYAAGARYLQLLGGVCLSFYDWYCDLPPASPEVWGEQTDVGESADWYKSRFIAVVGSNVLMTRTPDAHFLVEARHQGAKVVVFSPDFSQTSKVADEWVPLHEGQDGAFWMAVGHVLLKEFHADRKVEYFDDYLRRYSDGPILVELAEDGQGGHRPGRMLRSSSIAELKSEELSDWKLLCFDEDLKLRMPQGTVGYRWQKQKGQWNLAHRDARTGEEYKPRLTLAGASEETVAIDIDDFTSPGPPRTIRRNVPARRVWTVDGPRLVTTAFDILLAQYGIGSDYNDATQPFTPAWQEQFTGVAAADVIRFAREWGRTAETTSGRCMVIMGAGVNHWYHNNLIYRACITALMVTGCIGKAGGGWNHYVGQEKLVPIGSWAPITFASDWGGPPRLQNTPSFHYMHSDQWRYDRAFSEVCAVSDPSNPMANGHTADRQAMAVRSGWLPCFPQFNRPNHQVLAQARASGATTPEQIAAFVAEELRSRELRFSMEDPDNPQSWPRVFYIWRGNALQASAKGHEYFLKHYLGTDNAVAATEDGKESIHDVTWLEEAPKGKFDLIVDLNFRMDTSALYSDVVLPVATWYEKDDLNSTDLHSFIHPLQKAVPPCWESKSDWQIFRDLARHTQDLASRFMLQPYDDLILTPLMHDTPAEVAQPNVRDWAKGECEPIPGRTMPNVAVVQRDWANIYNRFISVGPKFRDMGLGVHGTKYAVDDLYDEWLKKEAVETWNGRSYPSLREDRSVCDVILRFAAETNGELAWRAYKNESEKTGRDHTHLAESTRGVRYSFDDLIQQPRRVLTTPFWTGITKDGRTYAGFAQNVEELIPWRTLSGRQHFYIDHETYRAFGEHVPTFKPRPDQESIGDLLHTPAGEKSIVLNYLTPHGKWHIHSTYGDTLRMETLSRGIEPIWMSDADAARIGITDNDWVEIINDHGVVVTRACVSARIPRGICMIYHATERTIGTPKTSARSHNGKAVRAGAHNSLTRVRLKPNLMIGGYAQFTWAFNYWGPPGINRDTYVVIRKKEGAPQW